MPSSVNPGIQIREIEPALGTATFSPVTVLRQPSKALAPVWLWPNLLGLDAPLVADPWQIHIATGLSALALFAMLRFQGKPCPTLLRVLADGVLLVHFA